VPTLRFEGIDGSFSGASSCRQPQSSEPAVITMRGRLSVVTYLHEFAHALGHGERGACRWSLNLFRRVFPAQFARLGTCGHTLRSCSVGPATTDPATDEKGDWSGIHGETSRAGVQPRRQRQRPVPCQHVPVPTAHRNRW
jgi:hypothetical protein